MPLLRSHQYNRYGLEIPWIHLDLLMGMMSIRLDSFGRVRMRPRCSSGGIHGIHAIHVLGWEKAVLDIGFCELNNIKNAKMARVCLC